MRFSHCLMVGPCVGLWKHRAMVVMRRSVSRGSLCLGFFFILGGAFLADADVVWVFAGCVEVEGGGWAEAVVVADFFLGPGEVSGGVMGSLDEAP